MSSIFSLYVLVGLAASTLPSTPKPRTHRQYPRPNCLDWARTPPNSRTHRHSLRGPALELDRTAEDRNPNSALGPQQPPGPSSCMIPCPRFARRRQQPRGRLPTQAGTHSTRGSCEGISRHLGSSSLLGLAASTCRHCGAHQAQAAASAPTRVGPGEARRRTVPRGPAEHRPSRLEWGCCQGGAAHSPVLHARAAALDMNSWLGRASRPSTIPQYRPAGP